MEPLEFRYFVRFLVLAQAPENCAQSQEFSGNPPTSALVSFSGGFEYPIGGNGDKGGIKSRFSFAR